MYHKLISILKYIILFCICLLAISIRLTPVLRYEAMIHEYDPYFNYRATKVLIKYGFKHLYNWFDDRSWYPLGRYVGNTIYPGLMWTSAILYWTLHALHLPITVRMVCVAISPLFASFSAIVTYLLATEVTSDETTGLFAALFIAVVPAYISR